jgi:hypothetical protein
VSDQRSVTSNPGGNLVQRLRQWSTVEVLMPWYRGEQMTVQQLLRDAADALEKSSGETSALPLDFDYAASVVGHFDQHHFPPTFNDWPRAIASLRALVAWARDRSGVITGDQP